MLKNQLSLGDGDVKTKVVSECFSQGLHQATRGDRDMVAVTLHPDVQKDILQVGYLSHPRHAKEVGWDRVGGEAAFTQVHLTRPSSVIRLLKVKSIGRMRPTLQP
jgi:hypothetical protein